MRPSGLMPNSDTRVTCCGQHGIRKPCSGRSSPLRVTPYPTTLCLTTCVEAHHAADAVGTLRCPARCGSQCRKGTQGRQGGYALCGARRPHDYAHVDDRPEPHAHRGHPECRVGTALEALALRGLQRLAAAMASSPPPA